MPPLCTNSTEPLKEAVFEVSALFARVIVAVVRLVFIPTATAPPQQAELEVIVQSVAVTVESSPAKTAPPQQAELEEIAQFVVVTVESPPA